MSEIARGYRIPDGLRAAPDGRDGRAPEGRDVADGREVDGGAPEGRLGRETRGAEARLGPEGREIRLGVDGRDVRTGIDGRDVRLEEGRGAAIRAGLLDAGVREIVRPERDGIAVEARGVTRREVEPAWPGVARLGAEGLADSDDAPLV